MAEQIKTIERDKGAIRLYLDEYFDIEKHVLDKGTWEPLSLAYLDALVKPGDVCVDVGANFGFHALYLALLCGEAGHVFAFEPNRLTYERLRRNLTLNPALEKRVTLRTVALGSRPGKLKVFQSGPGNAYVSHEAQEKYYTTNKESAESIAVECLDDVLKGQKVDLMKIDVEGMEYDVLLGAAQTIMRHQPLVLLETLLECFDRAGIEAAEQWLCARGYFYFAFDHHCGKLTAVTSPNLQEDSLAIPRSKLLSLAPLLKQANLYKVSPAPTSLSCPEIGPLWIVAIARQFVGVTLEIEQLHYEIPALCHGNSMEFEVSHKGQVLHFKLMLKEQGLARIDGALLCNGNTLALSLILVGGEIARANL